MICLQATQTFSESVQYCPPHCETIYHKSAERCDVCNLTRYEVDFSDTFSINVVCEFNPMVTQVECGYHVVFFDSSKLVSLGTFSDEVVAHFAYHLASSNEIFQNAKSIREFLEKRKLVTSMESKIPNTTPSFPEYSGHMSDELMRHLKPELKTMDSSIENDLEILVHDGTFENDQGENFDTECEYDGDGTIGREFGEDEIFLATQSAEGVEIADMDMDIELDALLDLVR